MKNTVLFLGAFLCANLAFTQAEEKTCSDGDRPTAPTENVNKVADVISRTSTRRLVGPAFKNPLAAGHAGFEPATVRAVARFRTKRLTGPVYKNRKQEVRTVSYGEPRRATRRRIKTGPRYKNRSAKTGG